MTLAAALFAVDPVGLGGVALRASPGSTRDEWLKQLKNMLPLGTPMRRVPINISDTALLGGLDLGETLNAGRPVAQQGILAQADGGIVLLAMAERLPTETAARLAAVLDLREVAIERDGLALRRPARLGLVALDEGFSDDEQVPAALLDRLAFHLELQEFPAQSQRQLDERAESTKASHTDNAWDWQPDDITSARALLPFVQASSEVVQALCAAALALGVDSLRAPLLALRTARAAAALDGQTCVTEEHVSLAARLVLGPRATQLPPSAPKDEAEANDTDTKDNQDDQPNEQAKQPPEPSQNDLSCTLPTDAPSGQPNIPPADNPDTQVNAGDVLAETVLEASQAAIPPGLLAALKIGRRAKSRVQATGRSGAAKKSQTRGRPVGARRGEPRAGARLNVIETLRAAAPWQKLRERQYERQNPTPQGLKGQRIHVRREDFHVTHFRQLSQTTTLFVVDASGSSALNRLAEAKGAVELLLADCYVRRDHVAVLAFRGKTAELLLPPTRSLARAKRSLAALPGGGGTPLATALDAARVLADQISRKGETPIVVLLTDGRGNIARDGSPGRERAKTDAMAAALQLRLAGVTALLLDTSPTPQAAAQALASEMGAGYVPLPYAGAQVLSQAVRMATANAKVLAN